MSIFNYYVIHMKNSKDRYENIKIMEQKLKHPIQIFFGINGNNIKEPNLLNFDKKLEIKNKFRSNGQLGCYLSHFLLLKEIYLNNFNDDYTIIFEDDFEITIDDLHEKINEAISKIDIDIDFLFLGIEGYRIGEKYKDNLYFINKDLKTWGFHGYIVKNKNINRILQYLYEIIYEVDIQLFKIIKNELLIGLFIYPNYVKQNKNLISIIRPLQIITTKNTINYNKPAKKVEPLQIITTKNTINYNKPAKKKYFKI